jgi:hypothetical protein
MLKIAKSAVPCLFILGATFLSLIFLLRVSLGRLSSL